MTGLSAEGMTAVDVGVSLEYDRVVLVVGEEQAGLPVDQAMLYAKMILDACEQLTKPPTRAQQRACPAEEHDRA